MHINLCHSVAKGQSTSAKMSEDTAAINNPVLLPRDS